MREFAYTFTYTPTQTTRRAPVYMALLRASALITREPKQDLKVTKSRVLNEMVRFIYLSVTLCDGLHAKKCAGNYCTFSMAILLDWSQRVCLRTTGDSLSISYPSFGGLPFNTG
jgi:hypothetical protein